MVHAKTVLQGKVEIVQAMRPWPVLMVGDGINDAPLPAVRRSQEGARWCLRRRCDAERHSRSNRCAQHLCFNWSDIQRISCRCGCRIRRGCQWCCRGCRPRGSGRYRRGGHQRCRDCRTSARRRCCWGGRISYRWCGWTGRGFRRTSFNASASRASNRSCTAQHPASTAAHGRKGIAHHVEGLRRSTSR